MTDREKQLMNTTGFALVVAVVSAVLAALFFVLWITSPHNVAN